MQSKFRIHSVDVLRGYAIAGILLIHCIERFNFYVFPNAEGRDPFYVTLDRNVWDTVFFLFSGKTYSIFALLFGFTFFVQFSRQQSKGVDFGNRFLWRMVLLFAFGWINSIFFPGEILLMYAVLAPSLYLIRNWNDKSILIFSIIMLLQPWLLFLMIAQAFQAELPVLDLKGLDRWYHINNYLNTGSFLEMVKNSYKSIIPTFKWSLDAGRIAQTIGLFSLGYYLGKKALFEESETSKKFWKKILFASVILFVIVQVIVLNVTNESFYFAESFLAYISPIKNLIQTFLLVSIFLLLYNGEKFKKITKPLQFYGRMSLSNYLLQSIIGSILFYPFGFYLANKISITFSLIIGIILVTLFIVFCNIWIRKFNQGPFEKIWHKLTWLGSKK
ncbi:DUF418 domain-containing protein [Seonamhaeicola marinus]|uniref:DUF418 domain-containing protein n=1 Tax=Seonamhaeicola marinus TaxID=1912246 RepID=A0A5D0HUM5_9FLAO|nr:DUF418 domain-containing protein [Seonamhaeicola marinus]TYA75016.1 DUF418 domain-containing protein [Seonamhaeicola marinus]